MNNIYQNNTMLNKEFTEGFTRLFFEESTQKEQKPVQKKLALVVQQYKT